MWWHGEMHFAWMILFWIMFIAASAIGLRHAFGGFGGVGGPTHAEDSPETILKRRYARGEIDSDEYETRLAELRK